MSLLRAKWLGSLLFALPLAAQPVDLQIDSTPAPRPLATTVPLELLRYPLPDHARYLMQKALQSSDSGDHRAAIRQLLKTLAKYPDTGAYVYSLLGVEYLKTSQFTDAIEVLEQSVTLLPHDASNHTNLGLAFIARREYDRARPELKRALELDPQYETARKLLDLLPPGNTASR